MEIIGIVEQSPPILGNCHCYKLIVCPLVLICTPGLSKNAVICWQERRMDIQKQHTPNQTIFCIHFRSERRLGQALYQDQEEAEAGADPVDTFVHNETVEEE